MLNTGPAIAPVIAISPKPFLVMARSAVKSPRLLPHASTVKANIAVGKFDRKPNNLKRSMIQSAVKLIQMRLVRNAMNENTFSMPSGAYVCLVRIMM